LGVLGDFLELKIMKSKIISGIIAIAYLVITYLMAGVEYMFGCAMFLILPLSCIWFSDEMGGYTGSLISEVPITRTTPGSFVAFGGWFLLLLPMIALVISCFV